MGFTEAQKVQVRVYLGWPALYLQTYSALEYAMQAIENKVDSFNQVIVLIGQLNVVDAQLTDAYRRIKADQIGEIKIGRMSEINILRSEGRRLVGRLAALLNTSIREDAFAGYARTATSNLPVLG
jgi:hypothetical protein